MSQSNNTFLIDEHTYERIKPFLQKKDGYRHIILLTGFSKLASLPFECEELLTLQLDHFITCMQKDEFELLDVKVSPIANPAVVGSPASYSIVIVYR